MSIRGLTSLIPTYGLGVDGTIKRIPDWLLDFDLQEKSGLVSLADNVRVDVGRQLLVEDFTAGLWEESNVASTIDDVDSFTTTAGGGVRADDPSISTAKTFTARLKGTTSATSITIRNYSTTATYKTISGGGAFDELFTFTGDEDGIFIRNADAGTTDIDWSVSYIKQTDILASSAFADPTNNPLAGADTGTTPGVAGNGRIQYFKTDNGTTSKTVLGSDYNSMFDPTLFSIGIAIRKAVWDTTERYFISHTVDADNWIRIGGTTTAGQLLYQIRAGGVTEEVLYPSGSPTDVIFVGLSAKSGTMKAWFNNAQVGSDTAIANTLVGNFVTMILGAKDATPTAVNLADRAYYTHISDEWTVAELSKITNSMGIS